RGQSRQALPICFGTSARLEWCGIHIGADACLCGEAVPTERDKGFGATRPRRINNGSLTEEMKVKTLGAGMLFVMAAMCLPTESIAQTCQGGRVYGFSCPGSHRKECCNFPGWVDCGNGTVQRTSQQCQQAGAAR